MKNGGSFHSYVKLPEGFCRPVLQPRSPPGEDTGRQLSRMQGGGLQRPWVALGKVLTTVTEIKAAHNLKIHENDV